MWCRHTGGLLLAALMLPASALLVVFFQLVATQVFGQRERRRERKRERKRYPHREREFVWKEE